MIKSMTGFGRGGAEGWSAEIRTVNHRFCDPHFHISRSLLPLEVRFREEVKKRIKRGRVDVTCVPENLSRVEPSSLVVEEALADQVYQSLNRLKERYGFTEEVRLDQLISVQQIFRAVEESRDLGQIWEELRPSLRKALDALEEMRRAEGENLEEGIQESLRVIAETSARFKEYAPRVVEAYRERLTKRLESLLPDGMMDENRLLQEVAIFADRCDITEETERLSSHIQQFVEMFDSPGPHGRRMEFLLQEMNREINTIGSKGNDLMISQWVVNCKSELEKLREQVQNVE